MSFEELKTKQLDEALAFLMMVDKKILAQALTCALATSTLTLAELVVIKKIGYPPDKIDNLKDHVHKTLEQAIRGLPIEVIELMVDFVLNVPKETECE